MEDYVTAVGSDVAGWRGDNGWRRYCDAATGGGRGGAIWRRGTRRVALTVRGGARLGVKNGGGGVGWR